MLDCPMSTSLGGWQYFCTLPCLQIKMVKKRKADVEQHFAFDDDTSDSEEESLEDFQKKVGRLNPSEPSETSRGQDGDEEQSADEDDESDDDESDSEEETSDDDIAVEPESKLSEEKKLKLSRLQEQLAHIGDASESESDDDDDCEGEVGPKDGANLQIGDKADDEEDEVRDETPEEDGDTEGDEDEEAEEKDQDQPENKKMKLDPSSNSVETGEAKARKKYQEQLSKMSIEEIEKLKERLGLKLFHQKMEGTAPERGKKVDVWTFLFRFTPMKLSSRK